ncbi:MAG: hypothetical protein ABL897_11755 [Hyphomicrobium sp.]
MALRGYQKGELAGVLLVLLSTGMQLFYVEPLKREIEWRLAAFNTQQSGQVVTDAVFGNRIALLQAVNASAERIKDAERARDTVLKKYQTADANIADYLIEKQTVEGYLQIIVIALFAAGTLLTAFGRAQEMRNSRAPD